MASKYECNFKDTYSGTEDLDLFLSRFTNYAKLRDFVDDKKVLYLGLRLKGPAALWFADLPDSQKQKYDDVVSGLGLVFEGKGVRWVREAKLAERQQGENESIDLYLTEIVHLSRQLHCSENEQLSRFVRGLRPSLRAFVISKEPEDMADVINFARLGESVEKLSTPTPEKINVIESNLVINDVCQKLDQLQIQVNKIETTMSSNKKIQRNFRRNRIPSGCNESPSKQFNGVCNRCQKYGHKQVDCFSKFHKKW